MKEKIRIASGQGFWGDLPRAPIDQVFKGEIDYLVMDYLAEVTMSILQKQKEKNPLLGFAKDLPELMRVILPECVKKSIKVVTNGGGVNPKQCALEILKIAKELNIPKLKIGVVSGDNIKSEIVSLINSGNPLNNMETGEPISEVSNNLLSANVYFGAAPIVEALKNGADIVITGRTTDTGLTLAPMVYEFNWDLANFDLMAAGTIAGHILECGAQASGGNFLGDWESIENFAEIGFPIAEAFPDGSFIITKHKNSGGLVSVDTVSEQLLYEIGNPKDYITPDCVADFSSVKIEPAGINRVRVFDIKGSIATDSYKVSCSYSDGYLVTGGLTYSWPKALAKARKAAEIIKQRTDLLKIEYDELNTEFVGFNACHGPLAKVLPEDDINEITLRISLRTHNLPDAERFSKEIAPLILTGPPSATGFAGGRPKPQAVVAYWPALLKKDAVIPLIDFLEIK